jgi:site-specific recombinase XerD
MFDYTSNTVLLFERADKRCALYFQCYINKQRSRLKIGYAVFKHEFSTKSQRVLKKNKDADTINAVIEAYEVKAKQLFKDSRRDQVPLSKDIFEDLLLNRKQFGSFSDFFKHQIEVEKEEKELGTIKNYQKSLRYLDAFKKDIKFYEVTVEFLTSWNVFLRKQKVRTGKRKGEVLSTNYIYNLNKQVKKMISLAVRNGLIKENPYVAYKIKYIETVKDFLLPVELLKYAKLYDTKTLPSHLQDTLQMFLFQCATGFRISDTLRLTSANICGDSIVMRVQKTKRLKLEERFPVCQFAKKYLPSCAGKLFKFTHGQQQNKNLAKITHYLNIDKEVTSKTARDTFAMNFLFAGGKVEVLQRLMGHEDINTTMIYIQIKEAFKNNELEKLDVFLASFV